MTKQIITKDQIKLTLKIKLKKIKLLKVLILNLVFSKLRSFVRRTSSVLGSPSTES